MSYSLQPHELQHTRLPCPSLSPWVCSNSCLLSWWWYSMISSSVATFSWPQSFPASGSFPVSYLFKSGGQSIGASTSASVLSGLTSFRIDWLDLLAVQGTLRSLLQHMIKKHQFFCFQPSLWSNSHTCTWLLGKKMHVHKYVLIYAFFFIFFSIMVYHRILDIVPCAIH